MIGRQIHVNEQGPSDATVPLTILQDAAGVEIGKDPLKGRRLHFSDYKLQVLGVPIIQLCLEESALGDKESFVNLIKFPLRSYDDGDCLVKGAASISLAPGNVVRVHIIKG